MYRLNLKTRVLLLLRAAPYSPSYLVRYCCAYLASCAYTQLLFIVKETAPAAAAYSLLNYLANAPFDANKRMLERVQVIHIFVLAVNMVGT